MNNEDRGAEERERRGLCLRDDVNIAATADVNVADRGNEVT